MLRSMDFTSWSLHPLRCQVSTCVPLLSYYVHNFLFVFDADAGLGVKFVSDQRKLSSLIDGM